MLDICSKYMTTLCKLTSTYFSLITWFHCTRFHCARFHEGLYSTLHLVSFNGHLWTRASARMTTEGGQFLHPVRYPSDLTNSRACLCSSSTICWHGGFQPRFLIRQPWATVFLLHADYPFCRGLTGVVSTD